MSISGAIQEGLRFFDTWNVVFILGWFAVGGAISYYSAPASIAIALFTGVYALIAFNRMRDGGSIKEESSVVRPVYEYDSKSDTYDFGLRNFGTGPVFELRVHARIGDESACTIIERNEKPLYLKEGEFTSVLRGALADLRDEDSPLYDAENNTEVKLYYTWESRTGTQYPEDQSQPHRSDMGSVIETVDSSKRGPRSVKLSDVRQRCAKKQYAVNTA